MSEATLTLQALVASFGFLLLPRQRSDFRCLHFVVEGEPISPM
jgi:hypothetical protein